MNRRESILALLALGGARTAFAQADRPRRLDVLVGYAASDADAHALRLKVFSEALADRGWKEGGNLHTDVRFGANDADAVLALAKELVALKPDVILAGTTPAMAALYQQTRSIPIVFTGLGSDPVASGWVKSLAHPGGNVTGLIQFDAALGQKWVQLLKEMAPRVKRVTVIFNPVTEPYAEQYLQPLRSVAAKLGVEVFTAAIAGDADIEKTFAGLARTPGSAAVGLPGTSILRHRKLIIDLAARHKIPTIFGYASFAEIGALAGYSPDISDLYRRAASYVDAVLRGTKAGDLPVEHPTKYELAINRSTAKALGLTIPQSLLARADRLIE